MILQLLLFGLSFSAPNSSISLYNGLAPSSTFGEYDTTDKVLNLNIGFTFKYKTYGNYYGEFDYDITTTLEDVEYITFNLDTLKCFSGSSSSFYVQLVGSVVFWNSTESQSKSVNFYNQFDYINDALMYEELVKNGDGSIITICTTNGFNSGYTDGVIDGYKDGYTNGYDDAKNSIQATNNVIDWFKSVWDAIARFMSLEIAPNLTLGILISIPIACAVLMFVLKALIQ